VQTAHVSKRRKKVKKVKRVSLAIILIATSLTGCGTAVRGLKAGLAVMEAERSVQQPTKLVEESPADDRRGGAEDSISCRPRQGDIDGGVCLGGGE
jgi:hypothetical protein